MSLLTLPIMGGHTSELVDNHSHERQWSLLSQHMLQEVTNMSSELSHSGSWLHHELADQSHTQYRTVLCCDYQFKEMHLFDCMDVLHMYTALDLL